MIENPWKSVIKFSIPLVMWLFYLPWNPLEKKKKLDVIFVFCWPCILLWFLVNKQIDAHFFPMCLFKFSTCFEQPRAHHQENQLYQYNIWYVSLCAVTVWCAGLWPAHQTVTACRHGIDHVSNDEHIESYL